MGNNRYVYLCNRKWMRVGICVLFHILYEIKLWEIPDILNSLYLITSFYSSWPPGYSQIMSDNWFNLIGIKRFLVCLQMIDTNCSNFFANISETVHLRLYKCITGTHKPPPNHSNLGL